VKLLLLVALAFVACSKSASPPKADPVVEEFRSTERTCIAAFNDALARQRANQIDELALAQEIDRDVLGPWRAAREKVNASPKTDELYTTLRKYLEARQIAWEAYVAALRSDSEAAARPHYDVYHQKHAEAQDLARELGRLFRSMSM
jgi:hypothetical protein